jgi:Ca-activated chloride channel family protein
VSVAPLSTFSVDVDRASYANVRRFLNQGTLPPKDAVRIEELVNYFPYGDATPASGDVPLRITTEIAAAPWNTRHDLLRIALRARDVDMREAPPANLVFLVERLGLDAGTGSPAAREAVTRAPRERGCASRITSRSSCTPAPPVSRSPPRRGSDKQRILAALDGLEAGGSTAGGAGIRLAYDVVRRNFVRGGNNRGHPLHRRRLQRRRVERRRARRSHRAAPYRGRPSSPFLASGWGTTRTRRWRSSSNAGNGNYGYIDDLLEARKMLVKEMGGTLVTVAKDVKLQVEFNPARVRAYRLLGYEDRLLRDEDFANDAKDAGEIGAGHVVTALYEIVRTDARSDVSLPETSALRYQRPRRAVSAPRDELLHVAMRYKDPTASAAARDASVLARRGAPSESMRFASAVAGFGMLLRGSKNAGSLTWPQVVELARGARGDDRDGYRADFIRLAELASEISKPLAAAPMRSSRLIALDRRCGDRHDSTWPTTRTFSSRRPPTAYARSRSIARQAQCRQRRARRVVLLRRGRRRGGGCRSCGRRHGRRARLLRRPRSVRTALAAVVDARRAARSLRLGRNVGAHGPELREARHRRGERRRGGAGFGLALACDVRIVAASARMTAVTCDAASVRTRRELAAAASRRALAREDILLTGRDVDAAEAERIGLAAHVVADAAFADRGA